MAIPTKLRIEAQIVLFERALAQHESAERHWSALGDVGQVDGAQWRQRHAATRLVHLRAELAATTWL